MSITRLIRAAGMLLAVAALAALATASVALAEGAHRSAKRGVNYHAAVAGATAQPTAAVKPAVTATACPSPPSGPRPLKGGSAAPDGQQATASPSPDGGPHGAPPSGPGAKPGSSPPPCAWSLLIKAK